MLIQTDKALYKGGDVVNFRVFSINSETLPENVNGAVVTIFDVNNIKIKTFNATFVKGKFESSFDISPTPSFGDWKISVSAGGMVS